MDLQKHIWEGWRVIDFINDLEETIAYVMNKGSWIIPFKTREELKQWCIDHQPYYKKYIPEVVDYFAKKYNLK